MKIEGTQEVSAPRERVFQALLDPEVLQRCIPGCEKLEQTGDNAYAVTLEGSKGEGRLSVTAHHGVGAPVLDSAILTGPDGRRYDLLKHQILPGDRPVIDNSI